MHKFPIPKNYRDTLDVFTGILLKAPEFKAMPVNYVVTLDDVIESLKAGVAGVASRTKNPDALTLFQRCQEEIDITHQLYRDGKIPEAKRQIQIAEAFFKEAGKLRSRKSSTALVEDDLQPPPIRAS